MTEQYDLKDLFSTESLESIEGVDSLIEIEQLTKCLPAREKRILYLYACGHTQAEIAEVMGLTQQRICQILANICKNPTLAALSK